MRTSRYIPVPVQQRAKFEAPDPWSPNPQAVTWKLSNYEFRGFGPEAVAPGIANTTGKQKPRMLPLALATLLDEGAVKPQQLPALLHQLEKGLRNRDYPPRRTYGQNSLAVILVALFPLWLAWEIGFREEDKLFPLLVATVGGLLLLQGLWIFAQGPLRRARERRLTARFRRFLEQQQQLD